MMRLRFSELFAVLSIAALLVSETTPSRAVPLEPAACEQLQMRLDALRQDGVEADMAIGPEAARTRLPIDRFNRIGAYLEIEEQLNFRCGLAKQRLVLPTTIEGGEEEIPAPGTAAAPEAGKPSAPPTPKERPAVRDAAVGKAHGAPADVTVPIKRKAPIGKGDDTPDKAEKKQKKRPTKAQPKKAASKKAPAKVDDAYRPPPKPASGEESRAPSPKQ